MATHLFLAVRDVSDSAPGEGVVGGEFAVGAVDVQALGVHTQLQLCVPLVLLPNIRGYYWCISALDLKHLLTTTELVIGNQKQRNAS